MKYKSIVDYELLQHLRLNTPEKSQDGVLYAACKHALEGGKRIRACIVLGMAGYEKLSPPKAYAAELAAASVEYIHAASLIIDDLPCMDNDMKRRGLPTVHAQYGERVAQLASTCLMALAMKTLVKAVEDLDKSTGLYIIQFVAERMGANGASGGEMDEFDGAVDGDVSDTPALGKTIEDIINAKTSTFFEIAMILGWFFGGNTRPFDLEICKNVSQAARHLGMAYQIVDDMEDYKQDFKRGKNVNYVLKYGFLRSLEQFDREISKMWTALPLEVDCEVLKQLEEMLYQKVEVCRPVLY